MNKPTTPLHSVSYPDDWKAWVNWYIKSNEFQTAEEALRGTMKETNGRVNPQWAIKIWEDIKDVR